MTATQLLEEGRRAMSATTTLMLATAMTAAVAALAVPLATAAPHDDSAVGRTPFANVSSPPELHRRLRWFRWRPSARSLPTQAAGIGSTAVLGLASMRDLGSLRAAYGLERVRAIPGLHAALVRFDGAHLQALLARAPRDPRVRYLAPIGLRRRLSMPDDPLLRTIDPAIGRPYEWQFDTAGLDRALQLSPGSSGIVVGVIDSGVADVPDLAGKIDARWLVNDTLIPKLEPAGNDHMGHGTAVASLIAANVDDNFGMAGFGGASHLTSVHVPALTDTAVAIALTKLDELGVRIVNMSFGSQHAPQPILLDAIHKAAADGVLLVAAAGNGAEPVAYPAAALQPPGGGPSFGLAVGASNSDGTLASFSNSGDKLSLLAPGSFNGGCSGPLIAVPTFSVLVDGSCFPSWLDERGGRYAYVPGTSFSAPEVAGVAALIWAARPELKNYQITDIIKQSAHRDPANGWTPTAGCGVLDAAAALELATDRPGDRATGREADEQACPTAADSSPTWPITMTAPSAVALPVSARWAATARLRFRAERSSGQFAPTMIVYKNGQKLAERTRGFFSIESGGVYSLAWRTPTTKKTGVYTFCVTLVDRAGNESTSSCARISLR